MKAGLTTSVVMHAALLGFGLLSLSAPPPLEVGDVEALPVDIVPMEEMTKIMEGDRKAPVAEKPAPTPTKRPDIAADSARKVGDNTVDTEDPPTPEEKPTPVKTAEATPPAPKPAEKPKLEDVPKPEEEPKPIPATEVAPVPTPRQEVKPDPVKQAEAKPEPVKQPEPKPAEEPVETVASVPKPDAVADTIADQQDKPAEEATRLPETAPAPEARPRPAEAQTAKAPERKESDAPVKEASSKPQSEETGSIEDQVEALLNKQKSQGGGAKRSTQEAALGGKKTNSAKLSQGEEDALRQQLSGCWNLPAGLEDGSGLRVSVRFNVDASGKVEGQPKVDSSSGNTIFDESALRAVRKCDQQGLDLPAQKADVWAEIIVNFDPSEMF